ncbi:hypothetical protein [Rubrimonas cliftonensis]|uniref:Uncharacterized protein n=1 Tax=Rubrimonas cliftonensis TaxID=89524 RepID=A0A1H4E318_9RHOB|nr:hypothetical protein [Rubrimonas cliftonensis]SEA79415.1 hypothetical protein SAMN05444370_11220 [Rubrimonas cliftonensis]
MTEAEDLHARLEALENRLAEQRSHVNDLDEDRRRGLGALLEALSEQMDRHDGAQGGSS